MDGKDLASAYMHVSYRVGVRVGSNNALTTPPYIVYTMRSLMMGCEDFAPTKLTPQPKYKP